MSQTIDARLKARGIELPDAPAPAAAYVPYTISGHTLYISGQLPMRGGKVDITGQLASDEDIEAGQQDAERCAVNILAQANAALDGDLERIARLVKIQGFVSSAPGFHKQHLVINGASGLLVDILGERGMHARAAVGMAALPFDASVEVDAIIEIKPD